MDERPRVSQGFWRGAIFMILAGSVCWIILIVFLRWLF